MIKMIIFCDYDQSSTHTEQMGRAGLQGALSNEGSAIGLLSKPLALQGVTSESMKYMMINSAGCAKIQIQILIKTQFTK